MAQEGEVREVSVWPVFMIDPSGDVDMVVIGATLDAAKRAAEDYLNARLTWEARHSFADSQEYWVAEYGSEELHTYEWGVTP